MHHIVLVPRPVDEVIAHEVDVVLDQLDRGERQIVADEDGDPRLI